jgi:PIN like domain
VEYHDDPKNKFKFKHDTTDDIWLAAVAQEGWIVFSHDRKFHTLLPECSAIKQHNAGCFYKLANMGQDVPLHKGLPRDC